MRRVGRRVRLVHGLEVRRGAAAAAASVEDHCGVGQRTWYLNVYLIIRQLNQLTTLCLQTLANQSLINPLALQRKFSVVQSFLVFPNTYKISLFGPYKPLQDKDQNP